MRPLSGTVAGLALVATLGGCWPRIPGQWDDYAVPDETRIVASMAWVEPQGGYWNDDTPYGELWWGWLDTPEANIAPLALYHESGSGCERGLPDGDWLYDRLGDIDVGDSVVRGPAGEIDLEWDAELDMFYAALDEDDVVSNAAYGLDPVEWDGGVFSAPELLYMPDMVEFDGPALDEDEPETVAADELVYSWPANETFDYVWLRASLLDADDATNLLETVTCLVPASAGQVAIPEDEWEELADGSGWYVQLRTMKTWEDQIEGDVGAARTIGARELLGFLNQE